MKRLLFSICLCSSLAAGHAQAPAVLTQGRISFTRSVNQYSRIDPDDELWAEIVKKSHSKYRLDYFELYFRDDQWLYKPGRENPDNNTQWPEPADQNIVLGDWAGKKQLSQKDIFGKLYLVSDSVRAIRWKITDETRTIAGFACRRANAIVMDSIYVVAFYTDELFTPGGPESFCGLPGTILEVSLPHQHISWVADKVEAIPVSDALLAPPAKGKKMDGAEFRRSLESAMKEWGKWGRRNLEAALL